MEIDKISVDRNITIKQAIQKLDETAKKILLVIENKKLIGVITDGDIRRWILKNGDISKNIENIMNKTPIYVSLHNYELCKQLFKEKSISAIPIVNENQEVIDVVFWEDIFYKNINNNNTTPIVIMAGGKGSRLYPYTKIIPKPLIPIGELTIVERIMNKFKDFDLTNFYLTVNYKKDLIKAFFLDETKDYKVSFIEEEKPLGTAGSLYLLKDKIKETFFVSNCDILIDANYTDILNYHKENNNKITLVTSLRYYNIPYGVINLNEKGLAKNIEEKPEYNFLVNTGMYVLDPEVLDYIPNNEFYDMPELINYYLEKNLKVGVYPISNNSWSDMGEFTEMQNMLERFKQE